jgi:hypothetical protein
MFLVLMSIGIFAVGAVQDKAATGQMDMQMMMNNCPMTVPGTTLTTSDTNTGIAINMTTLTGNVPEVRNRVVRMAAMHSGAASNEGMMRSEMLPGTVSYEPIENGARLTLVPKDPEKLAEFRNQVRAHVEQMKKGKCSMMQGMMGNMETPKADDHSTHHPDGRP